jgi:hypothetical protein
MSSGFMVASSNSQSFIINNHPHHAEELTDRAERSRPMTDRTDRADRTRHLSLDLSRVSRYDAVLVGSRFKKVWCDPQLTQPNLPWMNNWADFWDQHRLGQMLELTGNAGMSDDKIEKLRDTTRKLLSHNPAPSRSFTAICGEEIKASARMVIESYLVS